MILRYCTVNLEQIRSNTKTRNGYTFVFWYKAEKLKRFCDFIALYQIKKWRSHFLIKKLTGFGFQFTKVLQHLCELALLIYGLNKSTICPNITSLKC